MPRDPSNPWVLLRRGRPPQPFPTREAAQQFFDFLRHQRFGGRGWRDEPQAKLCGPGREVWYCGPSPYAAWRRDDGLGAALGTVGDDADDAADPPEDAA